MSIKKTNLKSGSFINNVAILVTGASASLAIRMALTPIVTRIFEPGHFGTAALFLGIASVIGSVGTLGYGQAILLPDKDSEGLDGVSLCSRAVVATCILVVLGCLGLDLITPNSSWTGGINKWMYALGPFVFVMCAGRVFTFWNSRKKEFKSVGGSEVASSSATPASRIGLGIISGSSVSALIVGLFLGHLAKLAVLFCKLKKTDLKYIFKVRREELVHFAKRYRDFPLYAAPSELLFIFSGNLPIFMLGFLFSPAIVGFYAMANRLLRLPVQLFSRSVRRVYTQKCAELKNKGKTLLSSLTKTTVGLALVGFLPFLAVFLFGERMVSFLLGQNWSATGRYAGIIAPMLFMVHISSVSQSILVILRKQKFLLCMRVCEILSNSVGFVGCHLATATPETTLAVFALINGLLNLIIMFAAFKFTWQEDERLAEEIQEQLTTRFSRVKV